MKQEIWKDVPNYEGLYQVSNLGIVKSLTRTVSYNDGRKSKRKGRTLSYVIRHGYPSVSISKNGNSQRIGIHQLVAITYLNHKINGHSLVVDHKDDNPLNNNVDNLQIVTNRYNIVKSMLKRKKSVGYYYSEKRKRWVSQTNEKGKHITIGFFKTEQDAKESYKKSRS